MPVNCDELKFFYDLTYEKDGIIAHEQQIFDEIFTLIRNAKKYILIDMFLFNSYIEKKSTPHRLLCQELTDLLILKKRTLPNLKVDFITDPINTVYGGTQNKQIQELKNAKVNVIITNLIYLRDSNPIYSFIWRLFFKKFGNSNKASWLKHPFSDFEQKVSLRSYLTMINFKANHRKIIIADNNKKMTAIITSANSHDGSSAHSNIALSITGNFWQNIFLSESEVAKMSGYKLQNPLIFKEINIFKKYKNLKLLTEKNIKKELLNKINGTKIGDEIFIAIFYLSDRNIISSLIKASARDVKIKLVLDPNKDAFGYKKNGIPNRPVASILRKKSNNKIKIRWYNTNGEQFHTKLIFIKKQIGKNYIILGSANLTRRNLENYNLELDVMITGDNNDVSIKNIYNYSKMIWENRDNKNYTIDYKKYMDNSFFKIALYYLQETSGISSF